MVAPAEDPPSRQRRLSVLNKTAIEVGVQAIAAITMQNGSRPTPRFAARKMAAPAGDQMKGF
jgi:hypothetical protein